MLNEDGAIPSIPGWTAHGFFSLNTRTGLSIHRRNHSDIPRLKPLHSLQALQPVDNGNFSLRHDTLLIPSNEIRRRVLGPSYRNEITPDQSLIKRELKRRRTGLHVWQDDHIAEAEDPATRGMSGGSSGLAEFDRMLPLLQRQAWLSFPSTLTAPIPFSTVRSVVCEADMGTASSPALTPKRDERLTRDKHDTYRRGNLLARFKAGNENVCIVAPSGTLDSVTAYTVSMGESPPSPAVGLRKYASCVKVPDIITLEEDPLFNMVAMPYTDDDETARLLATTSNSVCLARISSDGVLKWEDHLEVPNVRSSTLNPLYPEEFSVLSSEGLFCGTADGYRACRKSSELWQHAFHDVQCLLPEAQYRQVEYGTHPRTVLLASRKKLVLFDLRARTREDGVAIFDLKSNPETRACDSEIGTFCFAPNSDGFRLLVATRASLAYYDIRRPEIPILDWSLVLPSAPDKICAFPLNPQSLRSDVVVLASSRWGHSEVYHAVHTREHDTLSPFHGAVESEAFGLPKMDLAWSDLPLRRYSSNPFQDRVDGIAMICDNGDRRATVLQWSGRTGLALHPMEVTSCVDGGDGTVEHCRMQVGDNSVNLSNSIWSLRPFSRERCSCHRFPVSRSIPGSYLHSRVKRLLLRDVKEVRKRICSAEDDDRDNDGSRRIPRPYMEDLVSSEKSDGDTKSETSTVEKSPSREQSPRMEPAQRDDTTDRETIIGEAALLRSEESDDSDNPENGSLDFIEAIGSGCLFDELSRSVRSGFGHHPMPLGVETLEETVSDSPMTKSYETVWHAQCEQLHSVSSTAVSTADTLPSWLCSTVYFTEEPEKGESLRNSSIPEASPYGMLLARMRNDFFD